MRTVMGASEVPRITVFYRLKAGRYGIKTKNKTVKCTRNLSFFFPINSTHLLLHIITSNYYYTNQRDIAHQFIKIVAISNYFKLY